MILTQDELAHVTFEELLFAQNQIRRAWGLSLSIFLACVPDGSPGGEELVMMGIAGCLAEVDVKREVPSNS